MAAQQFDTAKDFYSRLLSLDPNHLEARSFLEKLDAIEKNSNSKASANEIYTQAQEHLAADDRAGALALLEQVVEMEPNNSLAHNDLGVLSFEEKEKEKALYHYERAVDLAPDNVTFLKNLADFYWIEKSDLQAALEKYVQALRLEPTDVETLLSCGQICMCLEKNDDAREFFSHVKQIEPGNENVGKLLEKLEQMENDTPQPVDRDTLYRQAKSKAAAGDLSGAIADLNSIVDAEPQNATILNDIGVLNYEAGNMDEALSCYEKAVALAPDQTLFQKNLADFYLNVQGRAEDAMNLYVKMLEKDPQDVDCLLACGLVCICMKNNEDARIFFKKVLDIEPWNPEAVQALEQLDNNTERTIASGDVNSAVICGQ